MVVLGYAVMRLVRERRLDERTMCAIALLAPAVIAIVAWSVAFAAGGHSLTLLADTYLHPERASQAVSAQMPNIWYPIKALYSLNLDTGLVIFAPHYFYVVAAGATSLLMLGALLAVVRRDWTACGPGI